MASALHRHESQVSQLPHHSAHLILVLVDARHPPLSPGLDHWDALEVLEEFDPSEGADDGYVGVDVS